MSSLGSFPSKAGICILVGFLIRFSAPGTRKMKEGKSMQGGYLRLSPARASAPEFLSQDHCPGPATLSFTPA